MCQICNQNMEERVEKKRQSYILVMINLNVVNFAAVKRYLSTIQQHQYTSKMNQFRIDQPVSRLQFIKDSAKEYFVVRKASSNT